MIRVNNGGVTRWVNEPQNTTPPACGTSVIDHGPQSATSPAVLLRQELGSVLRSLRMAQKNTTLRSIAVRARISIGYLSEVERGGKEVSSEVLNSICQALGVTLAQLLRIVAERIEPAPEVPRIPDTIEQIFNSPKVIMHG